MFAQGVPPLTVISTDPLLLTGVEEGTTTAVTVTAVAGPPITTEELSLHPLIASETTQVYVPAA